MFNFYIFLQSLLFLVLMAAVIIGVVTFLYHRWNPLRIFAITFAIVALAAAIGVLCA